MTATLPGSTPGPVFTAPLSALQAAIAALAIVPANRPVVPVLGGVVVDADDGWVTLSVFDYECSARVQVADAQIKEPGRILLDRADLARVLRGATRGETKRSLTGWQATITGRTYVETSEREITTVPVQTERVELHISNAELAVGGFEVPVACLNLGDFPNLPTPAPATFGVDRDELAALVPKVVAAAGRDATLPALTGVRLEVGDDRLLLACTNRFQLAVGSVVSQRLGTVNAAALIPAEPLVRAVKSLPPGPATIGLTHGVATLRGRDVEVTIRLLDAEFPRWQQLIPTEFATTVTVDRAALHRAADKATALADRLSYIDLTVGEDHLTVAPRFSDPELQQRNRGATLPATCTGDQAGRVLGFTGSNLLAALATFASDTVTVGVTAGREGNINERPVLLAESVGALADEDAHRHLLMLVRQNGTTS